MIFHITTQEQWLSAVEAGIYQPDSLQKEGFIHCSTGQQLLSTANKYFRGQRGLLVLCIAEGIVNPLIKFEDSYGSGEEFPHIYGELNLDAVIKEVPLPLQENGTFMITSTMNW